MRPALDYRASHEKQHFRQPSASRSSFPPDNRPLVAPIYQSVKFSFDDTAETLRYLRGERAGFLLFAHLESDPAAAGADLGASCRAGRIACWSDPGVATIAAAALALCKQGDHVLAFVESYGPTRYLVQHLLARYGVTHDLLSIEDLAGIERVLRDAPHPAGAVRKPDQSGRPRSPTSNI